MQHLIHISIQIQNKIKEAPQEDQDLNQLLDALLYGLQSKIMNS